MGNRSNVGKLKRQGSYELRALGNRINANTGIESQSRHRAQDRNGQKPAPPFHPLGHRGDGSIAARNHLIQSVQLTHERGKRRAHAGQSAANARAFLSLGTAMLSH
jgi:hypothetical protein